jgi:hypothetical protein
MLQLQESPGNRLSFLKVIRPSFLHVSVFIHGFLRIIDRPPIPCPDTYAPTQSAAKSPTYATPSLPQKIALFTPLYLPLTGLVACGYALLVAVEASEAVEQESQAAALGQTVIRRPLAPLLQDTHPRAHTRGEGLGTTHTLKGSHRVRKPTESKAARAGHERQACVGRGVNGPGYYWGAGTAEGWGHQRG